MLVGLSLLTVAMVPPAARAAAPQTEQRTEMSISFVYTKDAYTIEATASAGGFISPSGARTVPAGTNAAFSFTPASGYRLSALIVDGMREDITGGKSSHQFTRVIDDHTIHAVFVALPAPASTPLPTATPSPIPTATTRAVSGGGSGGGGASRASPSPVPSPTPSPVPGAPAAQSDIPDAITAPKNLGINME